MSRLALVLFSLILLSIDVATKAVAVQSIPSLVVHEGYPFGGISIFPDWLGISFSLNLVFNTGTAWGLFQGSAGVLFLLRIAILSALLIYLLRSKLKGVYAISLWLVLTGALGNAIDYLLYGKVVDFFHFVFWGHSFPLFNVADSLITLGALGLLFCTPSKKQMRITS